MTLSRKSKVIGVLFVIASALLSSFYTPLSSLLMKDDGITALLMGGFSFLGGAVSSGIMFMIEQVYVHKKHKSADPLLKGKDYLILGGQIVCSIGSTICLMYAIKLTSAENTSLYSSFEILFTSILAMIVFKEIIHLPSWIGVVFIAAGCALLSVDFTNTGNITFSWGSLLALGACAIWGVDNNLSRLLSHKNKSQATMIKGLCVGAILVLIGFLIGDRITTINWLYSMLAGVFAIGISIVLYMWAQKYIGASKTSAFYIASPCLGSLISLLMLQATPSWNYYVALICVIIGQIFVLWDLLRKDNNLEEKANE